MTDSEETRLGELELNVEVVLGRHNAHQALQFVELAEELGVHEINFAALVPRGRANSVGSARFYDVLVVDS